MLKVDSLTAGYGDLQVLWGVTITVNPGELVAIVGPNGAGKSTLMNTLSGLVDQLGGEILFHLENINQHPAERRVGLGIVQCPEGRKLFPEMSVEENLKIGAYLCTDKPEVKRRLADVYSIFPETRTTSIADCQHYVRWRATNGSDWTLDDVWPEASPAGRALAWSGTHYGVRDVSSD